MPVIDTREQEPLVFAGLEDVLNVGRERWMA
jgi:hypothetical protein